MSEVKPSDIQLIIEAYKQWNAHYERTNTMNLNDFKRFMETHFKRAGYRNPQIGQQNVLLLTDGPIGDFILTSPAIREIRRIYPEAHITLVLDYCNVELAEYCPYVDEFVIRRRKDLDFVTVIKEEVLEILPQLLQRRYDVAYSFKHFPATLWIMYLSGARSRVAYSFFNAKEKEAGKEATSSEYFNVLVTNIVPVRAYGHHVADCFLSVVDGTLHLPVANRETEIWYTPIELNNAKVFTEKLSRPLYALSMGARHPRRRYPPEKFAELVKMILKEEPSATFINFGGGEADVESSQLFKESLGEEIFNKHIVNLINQTSFRQSALILSFCDVYIGNNTGNMWSACNFKLPVLVAECFPKDLDTGVADIPRLFGPRHVPAVSVQPEHALPECAENKPYYNYGCRSEQSHCITQIEPETLFKGFKLLKEKIEKNIIDTTYIC